MMKEAKKHYVPAEERIKLFRGELKEQLRRYDCKSIERNGCRLVIKTELTTRYPKTEKLEIETRVKFDLVRLLACPDCDLDAEITRCVVAVDNAVKQKMTYEGIYKLCGFISWF